MTHQRVAGDPTPLGRLLDVGAAQVAPGRYRTVVDESWTVVHVQRGVLLALAARMAEHDRPDTTMDVTGLGATYLRPVGAGPVDGCVTWLRAGRSAAQATVDLSGPDGELAVRVTVVMATGRPDGVDPPIRHPTPDALDPAGSASAPVVPETADVMPFQRQHDWLRATRAPRTTAGTGPRRTYDSWFRLHGTPRRPNGLVEPLVACLAADGIGLAATEALGLWDGDRRFVLPTLSMDVQITGTPSSPWLLQHAEIHHLDHGLVVGTVHLFDEDERLIAFASQRATVRFF